MIITFPLGPALFRTVPVGHPYDEDVQVDDGEDADLGAGAERVVQAVVQRDEVRCHRRGEGEEGGEDDSSGLLKETSKTTEITLK